MNGQANRHAGCVNGVTKFSVKTNELSDNSKTFDVIASCDCDQMTIYPAVDEADANRVADALNKALFSTMRLLPI